MLSQNHTIRPAKLPDDAERILEVFAAAKAIMVADGNTKQWINGYPSLEAVSADIERNGGFVVEEDGRIVAYFAFLPSPEPTYATIYDGKWVDDTLPYHVVHRIASFPEAHGIFRAPWSFALPTTGTSASTRTATTASCSTIS